MSSDEGYTDYLNKDECEYTVISNWGESPTDPDNGTGHSEVELVLLGVVPNDNNNIQITVINFIGIIKVMNLILDMAMTATARFHECPMGCLNSMRTKPKYLYHGIVKG